MDDPFFAPSGKTGGTQERGKRKRIKGANEKQPKPKKKDEELDSDVDSNLGDDVESEEEEDDGETAGEKRLRLAKAFISRLEQEELEKVDGKDIDADALAHRVREEFEHEKGTLRRSVAAKCSSEGPHSQKHIRFKGKPVTCIAISQDEKFLFCGSKCGTISKWALSSCSLVLEYERIKKSQVEGKKPHEIKGHTSEVLALSLSSDGSFLASGGRDNNIIIWNANNNSWLKTFTGHRKAVTALAFRRKSHELFSGSLDRTIKIWDMDSMTYVETLYGHQDIVTTIDSLDRQRCLTSGANDRSLRLFKVVEQSQLVFEDQKSTVSVDCATLITENFFVSGAQNSSIALWDVTKKKPVKRVPSAHDGHWINCVGALRYGDIFATGSSDGFLRVWQVDVMKKTVAPLMSIPVNGFINEIKVNSSGNKIYAAVAQEPRLGRWERVKGARNGCLIVTLFE
eukprot:m.31324 g.31324  ORF g.31324 m.31324 type:complete len:455 (+) comp8303_c0_seq1:207-1571(+)